MPIIPIKGTLVYNSSENRLHTRAFHVSTDIGSDDEKNVLDFVIRIL